MGQCKICGAETEHDICDKCKQEMDETEIDVDGIEDLEDLLKEFELPELSGDLLETDLEFHLEDENNNLENPDIFVHDLKDDLSFEVKESENIPEKLVEETADEEFQDLGENIVPEMSESVPEIEQEMQPELPDDIASILEETSDADLGQELGLEELIAGTDIEENAVQELQTEEQGADTEQQDLAFVDDLLDSINSEAELSASVDGTENIGTEEDIASLLDGVTDLGVKLDSVISAGEELENTEPILDMEADSDLSMLTEVPDVDEMVEAGTPAPKISIWKRLFGNIKDDKWEKQKEKEAKAEAEKLAKEQAEKEKAAEMAEGGEGAEGEEKIDPKEAKKAEKLAKKQEKARLKEERKAEKQRLKELAEVEDLDEGRINRVGATIVFVFFGLVAAFVIIGTNVFSYNNSINQAEEYFERDEYNAAYSALNGLEMKAKDMMLYNQVQTVMYVNKELNSYRNYTGIRMYPEALDSLIKGLDKYDRHKADAVDMEVGEDLDKVKNKIVDELQNEYGVTEEEAYELLAIEDQADYSKKVIDIANQ